MCINSTLHLLGLPESKENKPTIYTVELNSLNNKCVEIFLDCYIGQVMLTFINHSFS